jgi:hypothetical protein
MVMESKTKKNSNFGPQKERLQEATFCGLQNFIFLSFLGMYSKISF